MFCMNAFYNALKHKWKRKACVVCSAGQSSPWIIDSTLK